MRTYFDELYYLELESNRLTFAQDLEYYKALDAFCSVYDQLYQENDHLVVMGADTLSGENVVVDADMVVLETAMVASPGAKETAMMFGVQCDEDNWITEAHPKLRPVDF